jgi:hypothetical protein
MPSGKPPPSMAVQLVPKSADFHRWLLVLSGTTDATYR